MILSMRVVRFTADYDRTRSFYENQLDMRPVAQWDRGPHDRGVLLVFNGRTSTTSIEVLAADPHSASRAGEASVAPAATGPDVSLLVEVDNVGAQHEALLERGVETATEPQLLPWGHLSFSVPDPDGFRISFYQDMNQETEN